MKAIISIFATVFSIQVIAADITCDPDKKTSKFAVKSEQGEVIVVAAIERGGTAYIWHSVEQLPSKLDVGTDLGSLNMRNFSIDPNKQVEKSKRYTFRLAQAWTPNGTALATCTVVVKK